MQSPFLPAQSEKNDPAFIGSLWNILEQKSTDPRFGVTELAACMNMSRTQLNRKLIDLTGVSPGKLIMNYRMRTAIHLLRESGEPVKQVAQQSGFQRHASFCRSFHQEFSCSPTNFRSRYRDEQNEQTFSWKIPIEEEELVQLVEMANQKAWLAQLLRLVLANLCDAAFTVDQLADELCISASSLNRKMKETFGLSTQRFIRNLRLQHAGELLAVRDGSVSEVAYKAGFFDHAHLCRCFKTAYGCSPSSYQREGVRFLSVAWLENNLPGQTGK